MGIAKGAFSLLCDLKKNDPNLGGSVLQLGRQRSFVSDIQLERILFNFGIKSALPGQEDDSRDDFGDRKLFQALGFEKVDSIDNNNFENATYIHDLNTPVPESLTDKYNCIFDGGTIEHIFHIPQVLRNIHELLKEGGYIIHSSPSSNHVDHGFYMFSPTLFCDYYAANNYKIVKSYLFEYEADHDTKPWRIMEYIPGCIDHLSFGGWDGNKLLGIWFVAQKLSTSSCNVIPQQNFYRRAWGEGIHPASNIPEEKAPRLSLTSRIRQKFANKLFRLRQSNAQNLKNKPPIIASY